MGVVIISNQWVTAAEPHRFTHQPRRTPNTTAVFGGTVVAKCNEAATNEQQAGDKEHHPHRILGDLLALKACESSLQQHVCLRRITRHLTNIFKVTSWVCIEHETQR